MELVNTEIMSVTCDKCGATHQTADMQDFRDSNTYPPTAHFMCMDCNQLATIHAAQMPKRLFAHLVNKLAKERFGDVDQRSFNSLGVI
ncbi:hypothetical protein [Pseudomonas sp. TWP3-2]|uniref:hypothetical protein n=1 Tax=Pseudomonas sp. TWP3-2 TaxID=2804574 RepID=UPI003CF2FC5B